MVIWVAARVVFAEDGLVASAIAALVGSVVFGLLGASTSLLYFFALILWLLALRFLFAIGWLRAAVLAGVIWLINLVVALFGLPLLLD